MSRLKIFVKNAAILGVSTLLIRTISVIFNAFVVRKVGAEGIGLYSLIMSVYVFAVTVSTSGINLAVTRLVSEELSENNFSGAVTAVKKCVLYCLCFGFSSSLILWFFSDFFALKLICDGRVAVSLRALSVSLPFIALSSVFSGYFYAVKRVIKSASSSVFEQLVKIGITVFFLTLLSPRGIEYACLSLVLGTSISEGLSFLYLFVFYLFDRKKYFIRDGKKVNGADIKKRMFDISLPIAFSSYLRSGLVTIQHILIPSGLRKSGSDYSAALSSYGAVSGMALPILLFPSAVCQTFSGLIIPELSELKARAGGKIFKDREICYIVRRSICLALLFGIGTAGIFICFSHSLGELIYKNEESGYFMAVLAPLLPVMYLDTAVDGMLKGIGEQLYSMKVNIVDALSSVILVYTLVPISGINGYIACIFITELLNGALSLMRLFKVTGAKIEIMKSVVTPVFCIAGACSVAKILTHAMNVSESLFVFIGIPISVFFYVFLLISIKAVSEEELQWAKKVLRKNHE